MDPQVFIEELDAFKADRLSTLTSPGALGLAADGTAPRASGVELLKVALANEVNVSELVASWLPTTPEMDVKVAFARQVGDEAAHYELVAERLRAHGFDPDGLAAPRSTPLFDYLKALPTTVERVAGGLYTLESVAYSVNEIFIALCAQRGDAETVRIYRHYIQPDEKAHQALGRDLLVKYARGDQAQGRARQAVARTLSLAGETRAAATSALGTACVPGC